MKYKPVKQNSLADALSCRPSYELAHVTTLSSSVTDLICKEYATDEHYVALIRALGRKGFKYSDIDFLVRLRARLHRYSIDQGLLCYRTYVKDILRIAVPHDDELKYRVLYEAHDTEVRGHLGREKTYSSVS